MTTPMFEQYNRLKAAHPDSLLFFRMGDFYELFFEDAIVASRELELTLTARNKGAPNPVPMAGVPHHAAKGYIERLVDAGFRVAIAEQVEDPALAKGLVRRAVVKVATPGVALDANSLDQRAPNYLAALSSSGGRFGVAFIDCSTGELLGTTVDTLEMAGSELARLEPREIVLSPDLSPKPLARWMKRARVSPAVADSFIDAGHSPGHPALAQALSAALAYGRAMSGGDLPALQPLTLYTPAGFMVVDPVSRQNLELSRTTRTQQRKGSLLHLLDRCQTPMGSRMLKEWLAFPLMSLPDIRARHDAVQAFYDDSSLRERIRLALRPVSDIERIAGRVAQGIAHARDLAALANALDAAPALREICDIEEALRDRGPRDLMENVRNDIRTWLVEAPPIALTEGGLIPEGAHTELDELIQLSVQGVSVLERLEHEEKEASGISTLKLKKNKVFGYFLEVTRAHLHKVPDHWIRKQTLSNCERFITPDLKELEERVLGADERRKQLELALFVSLRERVAAHVEGLQALARCIASLDGFSTLAEVAIDLSWTRPQVDSSTELSLRGARHPVVEQSMDAGSYVPNDLDMDAERQLIVLTGPNMAGKSTTMRQVALIVLLAQIGSFVPVSAARIGLVDRIFTRVGASDDLAAGQSTFMVEMAETAEILREATSRSLILMDEVGRGTSTYDGLSIAWSVAEDLADRVRGRTLFATHFHELCDLAASRPNVVNLSVAVSEFEGEIVFLRRLAPGGASRSYGVQCARLAGLPAPVVRRSTELLARFEKHAPRNPRHQLSLFGAPVAHPEAASEPDRGPDVLRERLAELDPDTMSPRAAHDLLYQLQHLAETTDG